MQFVTIVHMYVGIAIGAVVGGLVAYLFMRSSRTVFTSRTASKFGALGRAKIAQKIKDREETILVFAREHGRVTNDDVEGLFCDISDNTAGNYLGGLVEEGRLVRKGAGRGTYYELP